MSSAAQRKQFLRGIPFPFCAGCGGATVATVFLKAVDELGFKDLRSFVFCSGIGCASWIPSPHFKADSIHTTHGRSIPVATGVKLVRPDLNVVVFGGDGDVLGIGLSHLIHAARRNLDITVIMVNNMIYGMTGGQVAATTPLGTWTTTTPYGSYEPPLDAFRLLASAGASYVARWTTAHMAELTESLKTALTTKGFSFVEVVSQCPTAFGRRRGFKNVKEMLRWLKTQSIPIDDPEAASMPEQGETIAVGEFRRRTVIPTLTESIQQVTKRAGKQ
ncbi:MAG: 2-oxoacid:ferredoxin oxidoreductase subunit beta [Candidatus Bathyarchaeota archaeon]|nr:MAG: 2-oxoacid:ferredoxin oxidoreductase subunit beta [Candidatus Bathyarchaeota archaeon]